MGPGFVCWGQAVPHRGLSVPCGVTGPGWPLCCPHWEQDLGSAGISSPPVGSLCSALPSSEEDIVIEEFARQKLKGEKDDEDEKEEAEKEES